MRNRFSCNACKGVYFDRMADGTLYHHACPPLAPDKDGVEVERPNKRDENRVLGLEIDHRAEGARLIFSGEAREHLRRGRLIGIRLEGDGVKCLTDPKIPEPLWISDLKRLIEKESEA